MNEFQFTCPKCGQKILASADWSGRRLTCVSCEAPLIVPEPDTPPPDGHLLPVGNEVSPNVRVRVKPPRQKDGK